MAGVGPLGPCQMQIARCAFKQLRVDAEGKLLCPSKLRRLQRSSLHTLHVSPCLFSGPLLDQTGGKKRNAARPRYPNRELKHTFKSNEP